MPARQRAGAAFTEGTQKMAKSKALAPTGAMPPDIRARHQLRQKKKRRKKRIIRTILVLILLASACAAAVFLTPWFHITQIDVQGNQKVDSQTIVSACGIAVGSNTFQVNLEHASSLVEQIPYIKTVDIKRKLFPTKLVIEITESRLVCQVPFASSFVGIDEMGKVVENAPERIAGVPIITGVNLQEYELGHEAAFEDEVRMDTLMSVLGELHDAELLEGVTELDVSNLMDIKFVYQDRLKAYCGDSDNLERKLLMFKEVALHQLEENAQGEIDLTIEGKAGYRP